jgi:hypothetical protein
MKVCRVYGPSASVTTPANSLSAALVVIITTKAADKLFTGVVTLAEGHIHDTLFIFVTYKLDRYAGVFIPGRLFHPSLMFASKVES